MTIPRDFKEDMDNSNSKDVFKMLKTIMPMVIENYLDMIPTGDNRDSQFQAHGMDYIILTTKRELKSAEVKIRFQVYSDFAIEYISNDVTGSIGWANKGLWCDYFGYYIQPINKLYLCDWLDFRNAWKANRHEWVKVYPTMKSDNGYYHSHNVIIPEAVLLNAIPKMVTYPSTTAVELVKQLQQKEYEKEEMERMEYLKKYDITTYNFIMNQKLKENDSNNQ
jgi:hypothetical protein